MLQVGPETTDFQCLRIPILYKLSKKTDKQDIHTFQQNFAKFCLGDFFYPKYHNIYWRQNLQSFAHRNL